MGCVYSSNHKAGKDHYHKASSSSQDYQCGSQDSNQYNTKSNLSLDPDVIEVEMSDESNSGSATPDTTVRLVEKKPPSSPYVPTYLLEGRSFLQSPMGKKKLQLREFCDSPTRNRLSGRQFNDADTMKTRILRD